jgi:hypothetical protein
MDKHVTLILILLAVVILTLAGCQEQPGGSTEPAASAQSKAAGWVSEITSHLKLENQIESELAKQSGREQPLYYSVIFEETGAPAPLHDLIQGNALNTAAAYYALTTRDFTVTVGDVIDSGFYPFNDLPATVSRDMSIGNNSGVLPTFEGSLLNTIGTSEWLIEAKNRVLSEYYESCYLAHCSGCSNRNTKLPDDYLVNMERNSSFWINPITDEIMVEGTTAGDYRVVDNQGFLFDMSCMNVSNSTLLTMKFMCINNEWDSRQLAR